LFYVSFHSESERYNNNIGTSNEQNNNQNEHQLAIIDVASDIIDNSSYDDNTKDFLRQRPLEASAIRIKLEQQEFTEQQQQQLYHNQKQQLQHSIASQIKSNNNTISPQNTNKNESNHSKGIKIIVNLNNKQAIYHCIINICNNTKNNKINQYNLPKKAQQIPLRKRSWFTNNS
jgi:hypothetical protein